MNPEIEALISVLPKYADSYIDRREELDRLLPKHVDPSAVFTYFFYTTPEERAQIDIAGKAGLANIRPTSAFGRREGWSGQPLARTCVGTTFRSLYVSIWDVDVSTLEIKAS
jgi:hypothetical protein